MHQKIEIKELKVIERYTSLKNHKVILMGAGLYLLPALRSLSLKKIVPVCICDNDPDKQSQSINKINVISPAKAYAKYPDADVIIIAAPRYIEEIRSQLKVIGFRIILDGSFLLADFEYQNNTFLYNISYLHYQLDKYFYDYFLIYFPKLLVAQSLDIVITEKCSLKCRDCANLIQYYVNPKHIDFEETVDSIERFMSAVDYVMELRILGGEPFMNRNAYKFINYLRKFNNYSRIAVYTNATILPVGDNLQSLKHNDTYLRISEYGGLSNKIHDMIVLFENENIFYAAEKVDAWQDCANIKRRYRTVRELKDTYERCCAKQTLTLLNKHIHICPFAANAVNLLVFPVNKKETACLEDRNKIRNQLFTMLRKKSYFSSCKFCAGRFDDLKPLPAAIQAKSPLLIGEIS